MGFTYIAGLVTSNPSLELEPRHSVSTAKSRGHPRFHWYPAAKVGSRLPHFWLQSVSVDKEEEEKRSTVSSVALGSLEGRVLSYTLLVSGSHSLSRWSEQWENALRERGLLDANLVPLTFAVLHHPSLNLEISAEHGSGASPLPLSLNS